MSIRAGRKFSLLQTKTFMWTENISENACYIINCYFAATFINITYIKYVQICNIIREIKYEIPRR